MTEFLQQALRGGAAAPAPLPRRQRALVVGAGGTLGAALLAEALVAGRFQQVSALTTGALTSAVRGLSTLPLAALAIDGGTPAPVPAEVGFIVFERARRNNGRDDAFHQPEPEALLATARALHAAGLRRLLVVVPHAPALLPQALQSGFATRTEAEVAALGFEQLLLLRAAQAGAASAGGSLPRRVAGWWLSQLSWMVPPHEQPVRAATLAALAVQLALALPGARPGTRVVPQSLLSQAAQGDAPALLGDWLAQP